MTAHGVSLEVLDWRGRGTPIIFLAGLGNTAHIFDDFAPTFTDVGHILAITRRGFGASSTPSTGYDVPTLGGDLVRVLDDLGIDRAIFVGHSIAGEELTWLAANHPERVLGLIYLDAAYDRIGCGRRSVRRPMRRRINRCRRSPRRRVARSPPSPRG